MVNNWRHIILKKQFLEQRSTKIKKQLHNQIKITIALNNNCIGNIELRFQKSQSIRGKDQTMANGAYTKTHSTNAPACPINEETRVNHEHDQYLQLVQFLHYIHKEDMLINGNAYIKCKAQLLFPHVKCLP